MEFREIEIKLKVKDLGALEKQLIESGCVLSGQIRQEDVIYFQPNNEKDFTDAHEGHIAIRIRREGDIAKLTLKEQRSNEMDNIECETEIKNPEATHRMLEILGWKPAVEVKKFRKKGMLGEYEVCLDKVDELGDYIELEKMTKDDDNPGKVREELFRALEPFGLYRQDEETKGYDTLMYFLKNKNQ